MSIASLSFSASLPTYESVGSNGTVFSNDTLAASGSVLVNSKDQSTGLPSVLASSLSANGLNYTSEGYSISGNTLNVIYGLQSNATDAQQAQAADNATALSGGYPGNVTNFTYANGSSGGSTTSTSYKVATAGVVGNVPSDTGSAIGTTSGSNGANLSIQSISAGTGNTLDVVYVLNPNSSGVNTASAAPTAASSNANATTSSQNGTATIVSLLAGLPFSSAPVNAALGLQNTAQIASQKAGSLNPGLLLASILGPSLNQQVGIYNVVAGLSSSSSNQLSVLA